MLFALLLIGAPELVIHRGHANTVFDFRITRDGRYALTSSQDGSAKLWDLASGKDIRTFAGRSGGLSNANFSQDFKTVLTVSEPAAVLWDLATGKELRRFTDKVAGDEDKTGSYDIIAGELSPDGRRVATGDRGGSISLWDAKTGARVRQFKTSAKVTSVSFSPDGNKLFAASAPGVWWWSLTNDEKGELQGHAVPFQVRVSADGKRVISAGDKVAIVWDLASGKEERRFVGHTDFVSAAVLSEDGKMAITGSWDRTAKLWDVVTGKELRTFVDGKNIVLAVGLSSDNHYAWLAGGAPTLREAATDRIVQTLEDRAERIDAMSVTPDGKRMLTMRPKSAMLWDLDNARQIRAFTHEPLLTTVALSPNGRIVFTAPFAQTPSKLWDADTGAELASFPYDKHLAQAAVFSPNSEWLVTGGSDAIIRVWHVPSKKLLFTLAGHAEEIRALAFSHDSTLLVSAAWDNAILWDLKTRKVLRKLPTYASQSVAFSPDDKLIVSGSLASVAYVMSTETGERQTVLGEKGSDMVLSCAFSRDGKQVLTSTRDGAAKLFDLASGKVVHTLQTDNPWVTSVAFGTNGTILTSGRDAATHLWHEQTGRMIASFISVDATDYAVVTPDLYYTASKGATRGVSLVRGLDVYTFDNFDLLFNRPDVVLSRTAPRSADLVRLYRDAYLKRLAKLGMKESQLGLDIHLPVVALNAPPPAETSEKLLTFSVRAEDSQYALSRLNVFVNDVPVYGAMGLPLKGKHVTQSLSLALSHGVNKIQVSAVNVKGAESMRQTFVTKAIFTPSVPKTVAVVIGVSDYDDKSMSLRYAAKDADDLASLLESKGVTTVRLTNANATRENILAAKAKLMATGVDDQVILFVAGHGLLDSKLDWYFATRDVDFDAPAARGVSYDALEGLLDAIPARRKLLLMDACHSGEVDKAQSVLVADKGSAVNRRGFKVRVQRIGLNQSFEVMQNLFANLERGSGAMVISSASGAEYAFESSDWKNGVFTYALLEGLKNKSADKDKDGRVRVSEIRDYVIDRVQSLTAGAQHPTSRRENLADDFTVY